MTERIEKLISFVPKSKVFADIGCDHGYCTLGVLEKGLCEKAVISDISEKCLKKANELLSGYIEEGKVISVVSNGFEKITGVDTALIAGMGGEEIIKILTTAKELPFNLILQPMKNVDKVRKTVVESGYKINADEVFYLEKKYYDIISLSKGKDSLTEDEILFGRTNIETLNEDFLNRLREQKKLIGSLLQKDLSEKEREEKTKLLRKIEKYV